MKKIYWVIAFIIVVVLYFTLGGAKKPVVTTPATVTKPLKIGAILPLTGPVASAGESARQGIEKAIKDLMKNGTSSVEVMYEDGQYAGPASISAYNKLKAQGANAFLVFGTPSVMPLVPLVNADKMPLMSLMLATAYTTPDDYTFRMVASGDDTAKFAADLMTDKLGKKKIAVMYLNNEYGVGTAKVFRDFVGTRATIVAEENAIAGATDFHTQIAKIKSANPDSIFMAMAYKDAGLFMKQAKEIGINVVFVGDQPVDSPDFIATGGKATEGAIVISPTAASSDVFAREFADAYKLPPSYLSVKMYDSVKVLNSIAPQCESKNYSGECIKDALYAVKDFPGLSYSINYDKNGNIKDQLILRLVKDGKFVPYQN